VVYRKNTSENVNAAVDTITEVANSNFQFENIVNLNEAKVSSVINSLEVTNEDPIVGDVSLPGSTELKHRMLDTFATQNRAVVKEDYISVVYNMPPQYGAIKRVNIVQDKDSFKRNLNMYIVSEDEDGTLTEAPDALKNNLKTWLVRNKMINDTIDILDARIVNIGIEFEAIAEYEQNKYILINDATQKLIELFENKQQIG
jgi:hypothetical protein